MRVATDDSRRRLLAGVRARQAEIGQAVFARISAIGGPGRSPDPEYRDGLRQAVEAAIDHLIDAIEEPAGVARPAPALLHLQAGLAARRRVPLETVLRRYLAGHSLLGDFIVEEAERIELSPGVLRRVLRTQAAATDQAIADISASYLREAASIRPRSTSQRQADLVERLLDGELVDPASLDYDLGRWHLAIVLRGSGGDVAVDAISSTLDARKLVVAAEDHSIWVWLGAKQRLDPGGVQQTVQEVLVDETRVGIGEPARGLPGWRLSHEQAEAALAVSVRRSESSTRYADVALLASVMQDDLVTASLHQLYLAPLGEGYGGVLRETLLAYLATRRNITSAAAALAVDRRTVANRLRIAEERIGESLDRCLSRLEIALELEQLRHNSSI